MYGAGSAAVAKLVAASLGVPLVDQALPQVVATRLGIGLRSADERSAERKPLVERILDGLAIASPESGLPEDIDEEVARGVEAAIREAAAAPCVILGRAAGLVLAGRPDVCRVFVHAPAQWRIDRIRASLGCSLREAEAEMRRVDRGRAEYVRERYDADWRDLTRYDLAVDSSAAGPDGTAETIVTFARRCRA
jgi:cytidylate kinase